MNAINPQTWQDQEDGRALRELREAAGDLPHGVDWFYQSNGAADPDGTWVRAWATPEYEFVEAFASTVAQAADTIREALAKR